MKVQLISKTDNMLETMYTAAHNCYSDRLPEDIYNDGPLLTKAEEDVIWQGCNNPQEFLQQLTDKKQEKMLKTVRGCIARKHSSVMTHGNFTFAVSGVSRVLTHQLMRHHTGVTFDQQSQRYVEFSVENHWALPEGLNTLYQFQVDLINASGSIRGNPKNVNTQLAAKLHRYLQDTKDLYLELMADGNHKEDARYILPNCSPTNFVMTINLTSFFHIHSVRAKHSTGKSQKEIADFMELVAKEVVKSEPWLAEFIK